MSKIYENDYGVFISHKKYIDGLYAELKDKQFQLNPRLFNIPCQYNSNKKSTNKTSNKNNGLLYKEQEEVKLKFSNFMNDFMQKNILNHDNVSKNDDAIKAAQHVSNESNKALVNNAFGKNTGSATIKLINGSSFLFPKDAIFFSKDISNIEQDLLDKNYDLILLDPPWWNKYIRRKRKKCGDAYKMLFNDDLKNIPINTLLKENGMVIVWCTNSPNNLNDLITEIFHKWNVKFCGKWYWLKITTEGKPVCNFSLPPGKQPYEQLIFGCRRSRSFGNKLVVSIPSAIHSHKPPLIELLQQFLPENPTCLEIFARYLLPGWTSYGNEVLKLQHESLFVPV